MPQPGLLELAGFGPNRWGGALLLGAQMSVLIGLTGYLIGAVIGGLGAWAIASRNSSLRALADFYTTVLRGLPDLLIVYIEARRKVVRLRRDAQIAAALSDSDGAAER
jgi:octopine/nopaline transport system permease protein